MPCACPDLPAQISSLLTAKMLWGSRRRVGGHQTLGMCSFSKLTTELHSLAGNPTQTSEQVLNNVQSLIGRFSLDPNRVRLRESPIPFLLEMCRLATRGCGDREYGIVWVERSVRSGRGAVICARAL